MLKAFSSFPSQFATDSLRILKGYFRLHYAVPLKFLKVFIESIPHGFGKDYLRIPAILEDALWIGYRFPDKSMILL